MIRIDAGVVGETMEVVCSFPGRLDFESGLVEEAVILADHFADTTSQLHGVAVME